MKSLDIIQSGITVEDFLNKLNGNFDKVAEEINTKQPKIIMNTREPKNGDGGDAGNHGDIWIVYDEKE